LLALRSRPAGGGFKPPSAALAEDCRGERDGKGAREASGGDQEDVALNAPVAGFAVDASLLEKVASKPGVTFWPGMSLAGARLLANGLALNDHVRAEQVELDFPGDVSDAGLAGLAGGEVAGFLGLAGAGPVRAVPDEGGGGEDLQQERGEREIGLLRGKKPRRCPSRRPGRAGS